MDCPSGLTRSLCEWVHALSILSIPEEILLRTKHIILDGLGCGLVGASLPWSVKAFSALSAIESSGVCSVMGHSESERLDAPAAACLNSSFIQGFEMDDYHDGCPVHGACLILPALLATTETLRKEGVEVNGEQFLLATIVGLEMGPRIGLGLGGAIVMARGWHSGPIFGGPAVALAVGKLLGLSCQKLEWAVGTACTQAGGLMSAQYGSMAKR